jgi:hypothetical protein
VTSAASSRLIIDPANFTLICLSYLHEPLHNQEDHSMKPFSPVPDPRDLRKRLRMNQSEFWSRIGVTQSGGSRYESGRALPKPVRELVRLVYMRDVPLEIANGTDLHVAALLKKQKPALYRELRKSAIKRHQ